MLLLATPSEDHTYPIYPQCHFCICLLYSCVCVLCICRGCHNKFLHCEVPRCVHWPSWPLVAHYIAGVVFVFWMLYFVFFFFCIFRFVIILRSVSWPDLLLPFILLRSSSPLNITSRPCPYPNHTHCGSFLVSSSHLFFRFWPLRLWFASSEGGIYEDSSFL